MRRRSETIYANNQDDYLKKAIENEKLYSRKKIRPFNFSSNYENKFENDYLSASHNNFKLLSKKLSLSEKEKDEEEKLLNTFQNLNNYLKNGNQSEFKKLILQILDEDEFFDSNKEISNNNLNLSIISKNLKENYKGSLLHNTKNKEARIIDAISQNLTLYEEKLKIVVLGEVNVGKSLFVSNLIKVMNGERINSKNFQTHHTESFEIHKKLVKVMNRIVCVEMWDTNKEIVNSSIFKSK